ncbi:MAG: hypothetical protein V1769_00635 [Thermoplasmatota archaeon]|jgi:hypothetical protein
MNTYVEVIVSTEGEKASVIAEKLLDMGLKTGLGEHDFVYKWKEKTVLPEVLKFIDSVQSRLVGTKAMLKFTTL